MISYWNICDEMATQIAGSAGVAAACARWDNPPRILVGVTGDQAVELEGQSPLISVFPTNDYDVGAAADMRQMTIGVRWAIHLPDVIEDSGRRDYEAVKLADELGHALRQEVCDTLSSYGHVTQAMMSLNSDQWPVVVGMIEATFEFDAGLGEPALS